MRRLFIASLLLAACGDKDINIPDACNPLGGSACITPWPSSVYEIDDATTETKRRLDIPKGALPTNFDGIEVSPDIYNSHDGFSNAAPMMIAFSTGIDDSNLVRSKDMAPSLTDASPTVLIDMSTGELVPHFAELDVRGADTPASQGLYIRPAAMLKGSTRYAVAIKKSLKAKDGGPLPISQGFQAILDGEATTHPLLERVRGRYTDIFAALEAKGVHKDDLVVAWDFTTRSRATVKTDLIEARKATLALTGTDGSALDFTVTSEEVPGDTRIAKKIVGTFDAPLFLNNSTGYAPNTVLLRDGQGRPMANGLYRVPFTAIIPQCALDATGPVPIFLYGHGLLGDSDQVASGGTRAASAELCAVAVGTDMRGMSTGDVPNVALALNDGNNGHLIFDVLVQGMMNHIALVQIAKGPMAQKLFVKTPGGPSIVDPSRFYYYGISQGGIFGTTVCGIDPVIKRCVVQVAGINYSLLLERSRDWPTYRTTLIGAYEDPLLVALMINLMQQEWDRTDPTAVADTITTTGFPETPAKQVLLQMGIADDEVPNVGSEYAARTMGLPVISPSPYIPYGLEAASGPVQSGMVIYDFGLGDTIPVGNESPPDNNVHSSIRNKKATTDMMKHFYETGEIIQTCTAPKGCDCTVAGACGADI
ncbi:MAG: hypothetical protein HOV81_19635 [Kofleriaceae bacterium]|nr:hypothetical protein [Kofleriaceae bacterium]